MMFLSPESATECIDIAAAYYSFAAINIVTDAVILVMPIPALRRLNIQRNKRSKSTRYVLTVRILIVLQMH